MINCSLFKRKTSNHYNDDYENVVWASCRHCLFILLSMDYTWNKIALRPKNAYFIYKLLLRYTAGLYYNRNSHSRKVLRTRRPAAHEVQAQWVARFDYLFHAPPPILFPELRLVLVLRTLPSSRNSLTQLFLYPAALLLQVLVCCMLLLFHIYFCLAKV